MLTPLRVLSTGVIAQMVQPWTLEQAHAFTAAAWEYLGFK